MSGRIGLSWYTNRICKAIFWLMLFTSATGLRESNVTGLEWSQVDMKTKLLFIVMFYFEMGQNWDIFILRHKKRTRFTPKSLNSMVAIGGFEPPTPGL